MPLIIPSGAKVDYIVSPRPNAKWWTRQQPQKALYKAGTPDWKDVSQGQLGNCYALAAFISVALRPKGPEFIDSMLVDTQDGSAIGRMHSTGGRTHYIKAKKAICVMKAKTKGPAKATHDHGDLWVSMLEICLTCFFCPDPDNANYEPANASFGRINGGWASLVLRQMTGMGVTVVSITDPKEELKFTGSGNLFRRGGQNFEDLQKMIQAAFGGVTGGSTADRAFLTTHGPLIRQRFQAFLQGRTGKMVRSEHYDQGFLTPLKNAYPTMPVAVTNLLEGAKTGMRGKRGTHVYSQSDLAIYNQVRTWCQANKAVVADTRKHIASAPQGAGHSAGEEIAKGLVGGHAYAVEKAYEGTSGTKYIRLVNPWGSYIRKYLTTGSAVARDEDGSQDSHGKFNLKLADFVKRFHRVCASEKTFS